MVMLLWKSLVPMAKYISAEFEARRAEVNMSLVNAIESPITSLFQESSCTATFQLAGQYLDSLRSCQLWPVAIELRQASISVIFSRMLSLQEPAATSCGLSYCSCQYYQDLNLREELRNEKENMSDTKTGLCLDCVKTEKESLRKNDCRIKHH